MAMFRPLTSMTRRASRNVLAPLPTVRVSAAPAVRPQAAPLANLGASPYALAGQDFHRAVRNDFSANPPQNQMPAYPLSAVAQQKVTNLQNEAGSLRADAARLRKGNQEFNTKHAALNTARNPESPTMGYQSVKDAGMTAKQYQAISGRRPDYTGYAQRAQVPGAIVADNRSHGQMLRGAPILPPMPSGVADPAEMAAALSRATAGESEEAREARRARYKDEREERVRRGKAYASDRRDIETRRRLDTAQDNAEALPAGTSAGRRREDALREDDQQHQQNLVALSNMARAGDTKALSQMTSRYETMYTNAQRAYDSAADRYFKAATDRTVNQKGRAVWDLRKEMLAAQDVLESASRQYQDVEFEHARRSYPPDQIDGFVAAFKDAADPKQHARRIAGLIGLDPNANYTAQVLQDALVRYVDQVTGLPGFANYILKR